MDARYQTAVRYGLLALGVGVSAWLVKTAFGGGGASVLGGPSPMWTIPPSASAVPTSRTSHLSDAFFRGVDAITAEWRGKGAGVVGEDLLGVFVAESSLKPWIIGRGGGFVGLNQMGDAARRQVGFTGSIEDYAKLTADQQLVYAKRFFDFKIRDVAKGNYAAFSDRGRLYLANIFPAYLAAPDDQVLYRKGHPYYDQNVIVDVDRKGYITPADMKNFVDWSVRVNAPLWAEVRARLARVRQTPGVAA